MELTFVQIKLNLLNNRVPQLKCNKRCQIWERELTKESETKICESIEDISNRTYNETRDSLIRDKRD